MSNMGFFDITNDTTNGTAPEAGGNTPENFYKVLWITATVCGVLMLIYFLTSPCRYNERPRASTIP